MPRIVRSKRKTISLIIDEKGDLIVRAPLSMSDDAIDAYIEKNIKWIDKNSQKYKKNSQVANYFQLCDGEEVDIVGEKYVIVLSQATEIRVIDDMLFLPIENKEKLFSSFASNKLKEYIEPFIEKMSTIMQVHPKGIKINSNRSSWGACTFDRLLSFSHRLALCPLDVINYVVIHELSHILHLDHSKAFWETVEKYCPDYRQGVSYLKEHSYLMQYKY